MRPLATAVALAAAVLLASCTRDRLGEAGDAATKDEGFSKEYKRGPLTMRLNLSRREITIADRLELSLAAEIAEDYEVELPRFGEKLEQFGIVDYRTPQPELVGENTVLLQKLYVLEPFLSGDYEIPPMKVRFWQKTGAAEETPEDKHELETEAVTVKVTSLLPETVAELKIAEIAPPVELPRQPARVLWLLALAAAVLVGMTVLCIWLSRRRRRREAAEALTPAHELAYGELAELVAEDLIAKQQIKLFYLRISGILRRYIENRFGLHAPERTTEEFLAELRVSSVLPAAHKQLLNTFLTHCDLVKFAEHRPGTAEIQGTFDSCKTFIAQTEPGTAEAAVAAQPAA